MKIIAYTPGGYLVEARLEELSRVSGEDLLARAHRGGNYGGSLPVGMTIDVVRASLRLRDLREREEELTKAARTMRALADMLDQQLDVVAMPAAQETPTNG